MKNHSYSIIANGIQTCSGFCSYCSAAAAMEYELGASKDLSTLKQRIIEIDERTYDKEYKADYDKLEKTLDEKKKNPGDRVHFDIWGGDPVTSFLYLQDIVSFLKDYCEKRECKIDIHTSTNGLPLIRDEVAEWLVTNNIHIQLSHDALGQNFRTGKIDPVTDIPNVSKLIKNGTLDWINTTLNVNNYSLQANRKYWIERFKAIFPDVFDESKICSEEDDRVYRRLNVKLNHIYDGGLFSFTDREVLANYIQEWYDIYFILRNTPQENIYWMPFRNYLWNQCHRYKKCRESNKDGIYYAGACHNFQAGLTDTNFVIDTTGRYSQCNLIDADHQVLNPTAKKQDFCKDCRYNDQQECNGCGSVARPEKCIYLKEWMRFQENIYKMENELKKKATAKERRKCSEVRM